MINKLENINRLTVINLHKELENLLNADVFTYYGEVVNGAERQVKDLIEDLSKDKEKHDVLFVLITTPGGSLSPVQRMVDIFRHFYKEVNFIVGDLYGSNTMV